VKKGGGDGFFAWGTQSGWQKETVEGKRLATTGKRLQEKKAFGFGGGDGDRVSGKKKGIGEKRATEKIPSAGGAEQFNRPGQRTRKATSWNFLYCRVDITRTERWQKAGAPAEGGLATL